jgi:hypothetical protein
MPATVVLVDVSGSMATRDISSSDKSRWDNGNIVLRDVVTQVPDVRVITFGMTVAELTGFEPDKLILPPPIGGTPLHAAFELAAAFTPRLTRIVVICDGAPDDREAALAAARLCAPCRIDALFCGADNDYAALGFMKLLSLCGGQLGISGRRSLHETKALASEIAGLLGGPKR